MEPADCASARSLHAFVRLPLRDPCCAALVPAWPFHALSHPQPPQADTGTKMVHVGKNTRSRIVSKGISAGQSVNAYRGLVQASILQGFLRLV